MNHRSASRRISWAIAVALIGLLCATPSALAITPQPIPEPQPEDPPDPIPPPDPNDPIGSLDEVTWDPYARALLIRGWTIDPNTAASIDVHVYANGVFQTAVTASGYRPDVASAFPSYGPDHGYYLFARPEVENDIQVCVYGINVGSGTVNTQLGCRTVPGRHKTVNVCENSSGVNAGLALFDGDHVSIFGYGTIWAGVWGTGSNDANGWIGWSAGANFPLPGAAPFSLIYSFAGTPGSWLFSGTGSRFQLVASHDVFTLFFRTNDDVPGNGSGCFQVRVDVSY